MQTLGCGTLHLARQKQRMPLTTRHIQGFARQSVISGSGIWRPEIFYSAHRAARPGEPHAKVRLGKAGALLQRRCCVVSWGFRCGKEGQTAFESDPATAGKGGRSPPVTDPRPDRNSTPALRSPTPETAAAPWLSEVSGSKPLGRFDSPGGRGRKKRPWVPKPMACASRFGPLAPGAAAAGARRAEAGPMTGLKGGQKEGKGESRPEAGVKRKAADQRPDHAPKQARPGDRRGETRFKKRRRVVGRSFWGRSFWARTKTIGNGLQQPALQQGFCQNGLHRRRPAAGPRRIAGVARSTRHLSSSVFAAAACLVIAKGNAQPRLWATLQLRRRRGAAHRVKDLSKFGQGDRAPVVGPRAPGNMRRADRERPSGLAAAPGRRHAPAAASPAPIASNISSATKNILPAKLKCTTAHFLSIYLH